MQIRTIEEMLRQRDARVLLQNFRYPDSVTHPFDLLGELDRFKEYYCDLCARDLKGGSQPRGRRSGLSRARFRRSDRRHVVFPGASPLHSRLVPGVP